HGARAEGKAIQARLLEAVDDDLLERRDLAARAARVAQRALERVEHRLRAIDAGELDAGAVHEALADAEVRALRPGQRRAAQLGQVGEQDRPVGRALQRRARRIEIEIPRYA